MRRSLSRVCIAILYCLVAQAALAQSGSMGGTIGKTDKSASGGGEEVGSRPLTSTSPAASFDGSILGQWRYVARCPITGTWTGIFQLRGSTQNLNGSIHQDQPPNQPLYSQSIIGGHVTGNTVVFTHHLVVQLGTYNHTWSGQLSGVSEMKGQIAATVETCSFTASR